MSPSADAGTANTRIIISGTVDLPPENLEAALEAIAPLVEGARAQPGCLDYDWCPDPLRPGRLRVFERWESEDALAEHFRNEWYLRMRETVGRFGLLAADNAKYRVDLSEPVYDDSMTPRADFFTDGDR